LKIEITAVGIHHADLVATSIAKVGTNFVIFCWRTQATEFSLLVLVRKKRVGSLDYAYLCKQIVIVFLVKRKKKAFCLIYT
jgi:hypothetical protein